MLGADVAGSSSSGSRDRARELGVDPVYDYASTDLSKTAELQGAFDVVYDTSGTLPVKAAMRMPNKTGVLLDINATPAKFVHSALNRRRHRIFFCTPTTQILTDAARAGVDGNLRLAVGETVTLETAMALITELEKGRKIPGKALILVDPSH